MRLLNLSGLGPSFKNEGFLSSSLFDPERSEELTRNYYNGFHLGQLTFTHRGASHPLLRSVRGRGSLSINNGGAAADKTVEVPHLTTFTLDAILEATGVEYENVSLPSVWDDSAAPTRDDFDVVFLSTTFIWDRASMDRAVEWVRCRYGKALLVLGGQYSNLKFTDIMHRNPFVRCVVRGDGEEAIPRLLHALEFGEDLGKVPNIVLRDPDTGAIKPTAFQYIDLEAYPSPHLSGNFPIVPYESMRGCPFSCKFCSFPHASPKWRYKSAQKIAADWASYVERNGAEHIRASDSTFTTPPTRLRELLGLLPEVGVGWEAFARANAIKDESLVDQLEAAHCRGLSLGFESMSPNTLEYMNKKVTAKANRNAFELLRHSDVGYRCSFMVGFPGETPEDFGETKDFLRDEYEGHFMLNVFSLQDETMPIWDEAEHYSLEVLDENDPDYSWSHRGMDAGAAKELLAGAVDDVRWNSDTAVHLLWQKDYETPLDPDGGSRHNYRLEKLVERVATLPGHEPSPRRGRELLQGLLLADLRAEGVTVDEDRALEPAGRADDLAF